MASNGIKPQVFNSAFTLIKLTLISLPQYRPNTVCKRLVSSLHMHLETSRKNNTTVGTSSKPRNIMLN